MMKKKILFSILSGVIGVCLIWGCIKKNEKVPYIKKIKSKVYIYDTSHRILIDSAFSPKELNYKMLNLHKRTNLKEVCLFLIVNDTLLQGHKTYKIPQPEIKELKVINIL